MKFACYGRVVGTKYLGEVEAENSDEAVELAHNLPEAQCISVCHQCAKEVGDIEIDDIFVEDL